MPLNKAAAVSDSINPSGSSLRELLCTHPSQGLTPDWIQSLREEMKKEKNIKVVANGYQLLTMQFDSLLQAKESIDDNEKNQQLLDILNGLLVMWVYREITDEQFSFRLTEFEGEKAWEDYIAQVIDAYPKVYLDQLTLLTHHVKQLQPSIDEILGGALFNLHKHTSMIYFDNLSEALKHITHESPSSTELDITFVKYIKSLCLLQSYTHECSPSVKKQIKDAYQLFLDQIKQLIEANNTLNLPASWLEYMRQWIKKIFNKLMFWHHPSSDDPPLMLVSKLLKKLAQKTMKKCDQEIKKISFPLYSEENTKAKFTLINKARERCWFYFSLHEQLMTQWGNEEKYLPNYQQNSLDLLESLSHHSEEPFSSKKEILSQSPFKLKRKYPLKREIGKLGYKVDTGLLIDEAVNEICLKQFFPRNLISFTNNVEHQLPVWMFSRHESSFNEKVEAYIETQKEYFKQDELAYLDKIKIYHLLKEAHKEIRQEFNAIIRVILGAWLQEAGYILSYQELDVLLCERGLGFYKDNPKHEDIIEGPPIRRSEWQLLEEAERMGGGIYFFPKIQKVWSELKRDRRAWTGKNIKFVHDHDTKISLILKNTLLICHPDSQSAGNHGFTEKQVSRFIGSIKEAKDALQKFRFAYDNFMKIKAKECLGEVEGAHFPISELQQKESDNVMEEINILDKIQGELDVYTAWVIKHPNEFFLANQAFDVLFYLGYLMKELSYENLLPIEMKANLLLAPPDELETLSLREYFVLLQDAYEHDIQKRLGNTEESEDRLDDIFKEDIVDKVRANVVNTMEREKKQLEEVRKTKNEALKEIAALKALLKNQSTSGVNFFPAKSKASLTEEETVDAELRFFKQNIPENDPKGYFATLALRPEDTSNEIFEEILKRNYRDLSFKYHPDKGGSKEQFQKLEEANRVLSDPKQRDAYRAQTNNPSFSFR